MTLRVAVDFGTSSTCVAASVHGREPQIVVIDGHPLLSSAVYAAPDGTLFVGQEAERQAAVDPARFEPHPKRRIDEGELLLGDAVLSVVDVVRAVLSRAVTEARRLAADAEVTLLVLTHPADWGAVRTRILRQAAVRLAHEVALVPEPVAAAVFHATTFKPGEVGRDHSAECGGGPGDTIAVLDLGGGTIDASVVRRLPCSARDDTGFEVLATRGDPRFGGADIDQALLDHVGSLVPENDREAWDELVQGRALAVRRRRRVLRHDVRGAKETLSRHAYTDVPLPSPFADAYVTRNDLERLIASPLERAVELARSTAEEAGLRPRQLTAIFLVGGSSRIPLVARLIHEHSGVLPTTLDQPETVVARGALRAVEVPSNHTGAVTGGAHPGTRSSPGARWGTGTDAPPDPAGRSAGSPSPVALSGTQPGAWLTVPVPPHRATASSVPGAAPDAATPHAADTVGAAADSPTASGAGVRPPGAPVPHGVVPPQAGSRVNPEAGLVSTHASRSGSRRRILTVTLFVVVAAVTATLMVTLVGDNPATRGRPAVTGAPGDAQPRGRTYAQFSYRFVAPQGWVQTVDDVAERQVVIKPESARSAEDDDLIAVQEFVLTFDGGAERARLARELRRMTASDEFTGFDPDHRFAGEHVIHYRQHKPAATVDWYVLAQGTAQVSIGCQVARRQREVRAACEQVVRTLHFTN